MPDAQLSRRKFISSVALTGAATATSAMPFTELANHDTVSNGLPPDREIRILSAEKLSSAMSERIKAASNNIILQDYKPSDSSLLEEAEVIIGDVDADMLKRAKKLKWVQVTHAGVENIPKEMIAHPVVLTNMQKVLAPVIAETAIALLLSLTRGISQFAVPNFQQKKWVYNPPENVVLDDLYDKTIGIVGMGGIGSETARRLHYGFGMRVLGTDAKALYKPDYVEELHDPSWFMEMVPKVDVLMSAAPLTKETKEMFNEEVFSRMKPTSYFINVSRGGLVKQNALINALKNRKIRGAGLDVATPEPLPADNELWSCRNVVLTAHNSSNAPVRTKRVIDLVADNVRRYTMGLPLMNVVDKEKGY